METAPRSKWEEEENMEGDEEGGGPRRPQESPGGPRGSNLRRPQDAPGSRRSSQEDVYFYRLVSPGLRTSAGERSVKTHATGREKRPWAERVPRDIVVGHRASGGARFRCEPCCRTSGAPNGRGGR